MTNQARLKKAGNKNKKSKKSVKRAPAKAKRYIAREHTFSVKIARKTIKVECIIVYDVCVFDDDCFKALKKSDRVLAEQMLDTQIAKYFRVKKLIDLKIGK